MRNGLAQLLPPQPLVLEILEDQAIDDEILAKRRGAQAPRAPASRSTISSTPPTLNGCSGSPSSSSSICSPSAATGFRGWSPAWRPSGVTVAGREARDPGGLRLLRTGGMPLFQGYFFCRPELMRGRRIDANRAALLDLLAALHNPETELADLQSKIALDVGLSFRLLRYINSAFFGLRQQVRSIGQAVALLGLEHLKQWATLTVFTSIDDKPAELTITALVRARFCELAAHDQLDAAGSEHVHVRPVLRDRRAASTPRWRSCSPSSRSQPTRARRSSSTRAPRAQLLDLPARARERRSRQRPRRSVPTAGQLYISALAWADETIERLSAR